MELNQWLYFSNDTKATCFVVRTVWALQFCSFSNSFTFSIAFGSPFSYSLSHLVAFTTARREKGKNQMKSRYTKYESSFIHKCDIFAMASARLLALTLREWHIWSSTAKVGKLLLFLLTTFELAAWWLKFYLKQQHQKWNEQQKKPNVCNINDWDIIQWRTIRHVFG